MAKTIRTRLLILSDTHNCGPLPANRTDAAYREPLPAADVILHAGDITMTGKADEYRRMIKALGEMDAELKLVIAGNHDTTLDEAYYRNWGFQRHQKDSQSFKEAWDIWHSSETTQLGIRYLEEGFHSFRLRSGAQFTIYTSPYQPEFCRWAFAYELDEDRFNESGPDSKFKAVNPVPSFPKIDLMLTHGPPLHRMDRTLDGQSVGCPHLWSAVKRCRPRLHCFGHIHEGWGAERINWEDSNATALSKSNLASGRDECLAQPLLIDPQKAISDHAAFIDVSDSSDRPLKFGQETLFINASIMNISYRPSNAPFLVDLELPLSEK